VQSTLSAKNRSRQPEEVSYDWPGAAAVVCLAVAAPIAAWHLVESLRMLFMSRSFPEDFRWYIAVYTPYLIIPAMAVAGFLCGRLGPRAVLLLACSTYFLVYLLVNFRSGWILHGTFDYTFMRGASERTWLWSIIVPLSLGFGVGLLAKRYHFDGSPWKLAMVALVLLWICAGVSWLVVNRPNMSPFAPTRHLALLAVCVFLSIVLAAGWWSNKEAS
jgi:hypothetical protein